MACPDYLMPKSKFLIEAAVSFAAGILIASKFNIPDNFLYLAGGFFVLQFGFGYMVGNRTVMLLAILLIVAGLGALRLNAIRVPNEYSNLMNSKQEFHGYIVQDPDIRTDKQYLTFQPDGSHQQLLLSEPLSQEYFYGDEVLVYGKITQAQSDPSFDYQAYLQRFNIYGLITYPKTLIISGNKQNKIYYQLYRIKHAFTDRLALLFNEPQNSLLLGILIGAKKTLPPDIITDFSNTGTSHIIAISGYNITILIAGLAFLVHLLGRRKAFWVTLAVIFSFVIVTGASSSVVRAAIMGSLFLTGRTLGRQYHITASLFFAGLIMLIFNPLILTVDVGFQLSFAATLGIVYFLPPLEKLTASWGEWLGTKSILLVTMAAITATLPFLVYNFGVLSLISPIVNILVLPTVPITMLLGFLSAAPFVGPGLAYICNFLLLYILKTIHFFGNLPYGHLPMQVPPWFFAAMIAGVFFLYQIVRYLAENAAGS